jgi:hypothetical protein
MCRGDKIIIPFKKLGSRTLIIISIAALVLVIATAGLLTTNQQVPATGTITAINLGVYSDSGCTTPLTTISFGNVVPGTQVTQTVYLKNTGNVAESTLSMSTNTWSPANAGTYLTLTWTPTSSSLAVGASTSATLTLTASSSAGALSTFGFNVVFTGSQ